MYIKSINLSFCLILHYSFKLHIVKNFFSSQVERGYCILLVFYGAAEFSSLSCFVEPLSID